MPIPQHIITGRKGEEYAAEMMQKEGYEIIATNWRMGHLEMDVICGNRKEIVFVEVKTRTTTFGGKAPEEYVDEVKQRRILAAGNAYVKYFQEERQPRYDIIGILMDLEGNVIEATHLVNAYHPQVRTVSAGSFNGQWKWAHRGRVIGRRRS